MRPGDPLLNFCTERLGELERLALSLDGVEVSLTTKGQLHQLVAIQELLASHSPDRILDRVRAGRRLLAWASDDSIEVADESGFEIWYTEPVRALACNWRSHQSFDPRWELSSRE